MADFLLEIGLEEVPARMLAGAQKELGERVLSLLGRERLLGGEAELKTYSTPRRLAVLARGFEARQPDTEERLTGPAWAIAFKDGAPTPAAYAFAKKAGVPVEQLQPLATPKGKYVSATVERPGRTAAELLAELVPKEITALSWPKPMYWRAGKPGFPSDRSSSAGWKPERFVRPVQWIVALLDEAIVPVEFAGVGAGRQSYGHRVLHGPTPVAIATPAQYVQALLAAKVMADVEMRRYTIRKALDRVTRTAPNARWREDEKLVDAVTHMTEWPSIVLGNFAPEYLALPDEVLVTVMRDHQKYFAVENAEGKLLPHFLAVLNTETDERGKAIIRHGNERVLRARFNDAQFFWDFDRRTPLDERRALLEKVTFQKDLGSYSRKTERTHGIARQLAQAAQQQGVLVNVAALERAVALAKVDLTTELVKEFTELQGVIGGLYVRHDEAGDYADREAVARAIYWQYSPASITDPIPPTLEGQLLGLADRIGTIVDLFGIGLAPSGSRDPYALRRAANAVLKILAVAKLPLTLDSLLHAAHADSGADAGSRDLVRGFLEERLSFYLREVCELPPDVVNAVIAAGVSSVPDAEARAEALASVRGSDDLAAISAAWKRTKNILKQAEEKLLTRGAQVEPALLADEAESALWERVSALIPAVETFRAERNYSAALEAIATLRPHVDRFFDKTMVMAEDPALRGNRLALLQVIVSELGRIADFSELSPPVEESAV